MVLVKENIQFIDKDTSMLQFEVDLHEKGTELNHYWKQCVGSGHAALALREDWRRQLKYCHDKLGFEYIRFHGLFNDDMSTYVRENNEDVFSFYNIDSIFDYLLNIGMRPFVELSFMPRDLASGEDTVFHYRGNITPPHDYKKWGDLIRALIAHLISRYSIDEVRHWYFEVWNEPNLKQFWSGTQEDYFKLYATTARTIKDINPDIKVGGPASARNQWITEFVQFCQNNDVPCDFVSTHHYPTDVALGHHLDMEEKMAQSKRGIVTEMAKQARLEAGESQLFYTEWNNSPSCRDAYHDDPYAAAFAVKAIADNMGIVDMYSFWTFSDIFEEEPFPSLPFHGGFGLLNIHGIPKPTFHAFSLLNQLGNERLNISRDQDSTVDAIASRNRDDEVIILFSNHNIPRAPIKNEKIKLTFNTESGLTDAYIIRIDENNANAKRVWKTMGAQEYLENKSVADIIKRSALSETKIQMANQGTNSIVEFDIPPHGIVFLKIHK